MSEERSTPATIGELNIIVQNIDKKIDGMDKKMDAFISNFVPTNLFVLFKEENDRRLHDLESNQKWVTRTVIGLVISAVVALAINF